MKSVQICAHACASKVSKHVYKHFHSFEIEFPLTIDKNGTKSISVLRWHPCGHHQLPCRHRHSSDYVSVTLDERKNKKKINWTRSLCANNKQHRRNFSLLRQMSIKMTESRQTLWMLASICQPIQTDLPVRSVFVSFTLLSSLRVRSLLHFHFVCFIRWLSLCAKRTRVLIILYCTITRLPLMSLSDITQSLRWIIK